MKKRVLLIVLAMVLVAALSVGLILAYLTSHDEVVNTFTVGKVEITLDEAAVDEYGVAIEDADRVKANKYKLIPGHEYVKDPTVHVTAGSEACYVRMIVTVTDHKDLFSAVSNLEDGKYVYNNYVKLQEMVDGWEETVWPCVAIRTIDEDNVEYEFRYKGETENGIPETVFVKNQANVINSAKDLDALFDTFTLPAGITGDKLDDLENLQIKVEAHAIQADGFADANAAWAKFTK